MTSRAALLAVFLVLPFPTALSARQAALSPEAAYTKALAMMASPNPDFAEVASLLRLGADRELPRAQRALGELYRDGLGVVKDEAAAATLFRKAAGKGDARAQTALGGMYAQGRGVPKDEKAAVGWYRKAADQGDPSGQFALAVAYMNGLGIKKDPKEAMKWYRKAAQQGSVLAQFALGVSFDSGLVNRTEAIEWYTKALQQGFEPARAPLTILRNPQVLSATEAAANLVKDMDLQVPALARSARVSGRIQTKIFVDPQGVVRSAELVGPGHALLNQAALDSVMSMRYRPLVVNGQAVSFVTTVFVDYQN